MKVSCEKKIDTWCILVTEAVTELSVMMMASVVSEVSLATDRQTDYMASSMLTFSKSHDFENEKILLPALGCWNPSWCAGFLASGVPLWACLTCCTFPLSSPDVWYDIFTAQWVNNAEKKVLYVTVVCSCDYGYSVNGIVSMLWLSISCISHFIFSYEILHSFTCCSFTCSYWSKKINICKRNLFFCVFVVMV